MTKRLRSQQPHLEELVAPAQQEPDYRFTFANERTFLAWNRTALALIAGALSAQQFLTDVSRGLRLAIAAPLVVVAGAIALTSHAQWRTKQHALRRGDPLPDSTLPRVLAVGIGLVALVTVGIVLVRGIG